MSVTNNEDKKNCGRRWEELYPYIITSIVGIIASYLLYKKSLPSLDENLFSASLGLFGVLLGFLSTTKAILIGMRSPVIQYLQENNGMERLLNYIAEAVWGCFIACLFNIVAFFVKSTSYYQCYSILWISSSVFALTAFFRITRIMLSVLRNHYILSSLPDPPKKRGKATPTE